MTAAEDTGEALAVRVYGLPAPQGSKRAILHRSTGRPVVIEASKRTRPWQQSVTAEAREQLAGRPPLTGPVTVTVVFWLPRPKSRPRRDSWPDRRPDVDKLARAVLDALSEASEWGDDAQVCTLLARKRYATADHPVGADIRIRPLTAIDAGQLNLTEES